MLIPTLSHTLHFALEFSQFLDLIQSIVFKVWTQRLEYFEDFIKFTGSIWITSYLCRFLLLFTSSIAARVSALGISREITKGIFC